MLNVEALRLKLFLKHCTILSFARALGISGSALYRRLNGSVLFTVGEVQNAEDFLNLTREERDEIFFDQKVS